MNKRAKLGNDGFSLIEIIVALAVITIAGTVLFNGFGDAARVYTKINQLQMAEDIAQKLSEEFRSSSVSELKSKYSGATIADSTDSTTNIRTITMNGIQLFYDSRHSSGTNNTEFTADVTLTSKKYKDESKRTTTYKQHVAGTDEVYAVNSATGEKSFTNSFIVPEIENIFDGTNKIISDEVNQYDFIVAEDLNNAILRILDEENQRRITNGLSGVNGRNLLDTSNADGTFSGYYIPYTNLTSSGQKIKKNTTVEIGDKVTGTDAKYYYIVSVEYEFEFDDFNIYTYGGDVAGTVGSFVAVGDISPVAGATTAIKINRVTSALGSTKLKFIVKYEETLNNTGADAIVNGKTGTFGGAVAAKNELGNDAVMITDGSGDKVPYIYVLYTPFEIYSNTTGFSTDEIEFKSSLTTSNTNIVRAFLVVQSIEHKKTAKKDAKIKDCKITSTTSSDLFKLYTNSPDIIDNTANIMDGSSSANNKNYYMTNATGKNYENFYDLHIEIKDLDGKVVAVIDGVKED